VLFLWALPIVPVVTWLVVFLVARQRRDQAADTGDGVEAEGITEARPRRIGGVRLVRNAEGGFDEVPS
jgi:hypothetical protein